MSRYDVFISCKSEDYKYAEEIYDFLTANGINTFLASKELRRLGESEYRRAISAAMKDAYHLIIFASNPDYIESPWVYYEWDMFVNAKLKGFKPGNIITILKDVATGDINMDLWKYESLTYYDYKNSVLQYVETDDSRARRTQILKEREEELRRLKALEEERLRAEAMRTELTALAEGYKKNIAALDVDANKIFGLAESLGIKEKKCPVCGHMLPVSGRHCATCGYICSPIEGLPGLEYLSADKVSAITIAREVYAKSTQSVSDEKIKEYENHIHELLSLVQNKDDEINKLKEEANHIKEQLTEETQIRQKLETAAKEARNLAEMLKKENPGLLGSILKHTVSATGIISKAAENMTKEMDLPSQRNDYSVWVTFMTTDAKKFLESQAKDYIRYKVGTTNLKAGMFKSLAKAMEFKNLLENKGATVRLEYRGKPI